MRFQSFIKWFLLSVMLIIFTACGSDAKSNIDNPSTPLPPSDKPISPTNPDPESPQDYLDAVNNTRAVEQDCGEYGIMPAVDPLVWNDKLYAAAKEHSNDLAKSDTWGHDGSGTEFDITAQETNLGRGSTPQERGEYNRYIGGVGENVAGGPDSIPEVMQGWLDSDGHCHNIMEPRYQDFGMAVIEDANSHYIYYWTQNFGIPR